MSSKTTELTSTELKVIESLNSLDSAISQREIARRTGYSLGLINAVIKKLICTGYVKTSHLNKRSISYLLTPEGFSQAAMRSYKYVLGTVKAYRDIQVKIDSILRTLVSEGFSEFYLHGDGELAELVAIFFQEKGYGALTRGLPDKQDERIVVINTDPKLSDGLKCRVVNLASELGNGNGGNNVNQTRASV